MQTSGLFMVSQAWRWLKAGRAVLSEPRSAEDSCQKRGLHLLQGALRTARPTTKGWAGALVCGLTLATWAASAGVLTIELPPETAAFKPGPGAEIANGQCLVCHSVEYVLMQPPMPRPFWAASVKKMREKYGAPLPEEQVDAVVDYLTRNYGVDTNLVASAASPAGGNSAASATPSASTGEGLATRYGCLGCHSEKTKLVGPAYVEVAKKYRGDAAALPKIAEQIHKGGSGKWGPTIMPPFPMMSDAETKALAEWILSRQ